MYFKKKSINNAIIILTNLFTNFLILEDILAFRIVILLIFIITLIMRYLFFFFLFIKN